MIAHAIAPWGTPAPLHMGGIHLVTTGSTPLTGPAGSYDGTGRTLSLAGRRILVVEDEVMLAMEIEWALEEADAAVIGPASRVDEALAIASDPNEAIDAAILDVDLHGRDVFPVAEALRERGVPFVFHTGHGTRAGLQERFAGVPVCIKPTLTEQLIAVVAGLLE